MRVPENAGLGTAKVTYSFDSWNGRDISPTTVEIPVKKPEPKKESEGSADKKSAVK